MKAIRKSACFVLAVLVFSFASAACAASYTFSNSLNIRVSVIMAYVDADSGVVTARGWWYVQPGSSTVITVNADESYGVYYAAYNNIQYYDSGAGEDTIRRWASPRTFTYTSTEKPYDDGVWLGTLYRINGRSVNIDTNQAPRGQARENPVRREPNVLPSPARPSPSGGRTQYTYSTGNRDALAARLPREYLSNEELAACSKDVLAYLRNHIYANHGYIFRTKQWSDEFSNRSWYRPNPNFSENLFNAYERENLRRIMAEEKRR